MMTTVPDGVVALRRTIPPDAATHRTRISRGRSTAVAEGATIVRVGTAIFGGRAPP